MKIGEIGLREVMFGLAKKRYFLNPCILIDSESDCEVAGAQIKDESGQLVGEIDTELLSKLIEIMAEEIKENL